MNKRISAVMMCLVFFPGLAFGQSFFFIPGIEPTTGVDRGSTSQISRVTKTTRFTTLDSTGAEAIGRGIASFSVATPKVISDGDQLDIAFVIGGPSEKGGRELFAGGIGYRVEVAEGLTLFANADHGDYVLGTADAIPLNVRGAVTNTAIGLTREWQRGPAHRTRVTVSFGSRGETGSYVGGTTTNEDLRFVKVTFQDDKGAPFSLARRINISLSKGISGLGASGDTNPHASAAGSTPDFLRISAALEASVPLGRKFLVNAGAITQWTEDSLPVSQRCGYSTNSYARGFDRSYVNGDRCVGGRIELAYDFLRPDFRTGQINATQAFAGIDAGRVWDNANAVVAATRDDWSSVSVGLRMLRGEILAEVAASRILDQPVGAFPQSRSRFWFRGALRF